MTIFAGGSIFFTFYFSLSPFFIIFAALTLNDMRNKLFGEAPLLRLAVSLMAGIVIGHHVGAGQWLLPVLVGAVVVSLLLWRTALLQSVAIVTCFLLLGWPSLLRHLYILRTQLVRHKLRYILLLAILL